MSSAALLSLPIGVIVERYKADSPWLDHIWSVVDVLPGEADALPWTPVGLKGKTNRFYAGGANIHLHRAEASNYRDNLLSDSPSLWVVLRSTGGEPPYALLTVTADPSEGEAATEAGDDLVEAVPMPASVFSALELFVAEHDVDRPFMKRQLDRAEPEALARRRIVDEK